MRLNLTSSEFADIVACFLFDKLLYQDKVISDNEMFNNFMSKMAGKGAKALLMDYYLNLPSETRLNYKRIKNVFKDGDSIHEIRISPDKSKKEKGKKEKGGLIRKAVKIVKKLLKKEEVSKEDVNFLLETIKEERINE